MRPGRYRVCIHTYEAADALGRTIRLERGGSYLTGDEQEGMITVFTDRWADVPLSLFLPEGEE